MKDKDFNGFHFDDPLMRKEMRYLVVTDGDLDLNGCYAFKNKTNLKEYLKNSSYKRIQAVFELKDLTAELTPLRKTR